MAQAQPSGTVTLVFTDIEGSTRLLEELGTDGYLEALAEHRQVVREACARHEGYEVDFEGDAFFYAFSSAQQAVSAVSEAMAGLDGGPIRIRVGVHTGEPALDPPKYVGMDVHRAARIMSSAHGGQVVLSPSTVALLQPGSVVIKELGQHRLKDLSTPIALHQLLIDGLPADFPPLKTLYRSNLPVPATPFLGRDAELARKLGDDLALVFALRDLGNACLQPLDEERATTAYEESREIARAIGDVNGEAGSVINLGALAMATGRWQAALDLTREAVALNETIGDPESTATTLYNEALALWQLGSPEDPRPLLEGALRLADDREWQEGLLFPLELLGAVDVARGDTERGTMLLGAGDRLRHEIGIGDYDPVHGEVVEAARETAAELLGPGTRDALLRRGCELELAAAVALALGEALPD